MADRVPVFIDGQNTLKCAREAFFPGQTRHYTDGQFDPMEVAQLLLGRTPAGFTRELEQVRVYIGRPDGALDPKTYAPHMRQCAGWERDGARVIWKPLRYPPDFPDSKAEEKGIDVQIAVDLVVGAFDRQYDVGIVFSTDTDLRPALEWVTNRYPRMPRVEVAAWTSPSSNRRIPTQASRPVFCHYLTSTDYARVADSTDYTRR